MLRDIPPPPSLPLWIAHWPLPAYRYVPGLHPHPFRAPDGHMYVDGGPPPHPPWDPGTPWRDDRRWLRAVDLFNHRYVWEAHEVWEGLWHAVSDDAILSDLLQGLVQASAFSLKRHMGHRRSCELLLGRARARLVRVHAARGDVVRGLPLEDVVRSLEAFHAGGPWPLLVLP